MPVLSRQQIIDRIRNGSLVISPILAQKQLGVSSVDLRMGNVVLTARARGLAFVNPSAYAAASANDHASAVGKRQKHERSELPFEKRFLLHPGNLALVPTLEWVKLPMDVQGVVTARSSWAREGLSIATASFVEPGYEGVITLELANLGDIPIALFPGLRVAQIALNKLETPAVRRPDEQSQFQLSFEPTGGDISQSDEKFIPPL